MDAVTIDALYIPVEPMEPPHGPEEVDPDTLPVPKHNRLTVNTT